MLQFIATRMELLTLRRRIWIKLYSIPIALFQGLMHYLPNTSTSSAMITIPTLNLFSHSTKEVYLKVRTADGLIGQFLVTRFQDRNSQAQEARMRQPLHLNLLKPGLMPMVA